MAVESISSPISWISEELLTDGNQFFLSLIEGINNAKDSINIESYIFNNDNLGKRVAEALINAAKRGVLVRVIVDGVGSYGWIFSIGIQLASENILIKIYHQLPWEKLISHRLRSDDNQSLFTLFNFINRRNHRKICIVDSSIVWNGSMNLWDMSLPHGDGEPAWREMGIKVRGEGVRYFCAAFDLIWYERSLKNRNIRKIAKSIVKKSEFSLVRINSTMYLRRRLYKNLLNRLGHAKERIWIANAYFVPSRSFINALKDAVARGVDVRLLISLQSDIFFMPWVSATFHHLLLKNGVKLFGYEPSIFHAKYMIVDEYAIIGSTNINQRSLLHDLEADVIITSQSTLNLITAEFINDLKVSKLIKYEDFIQMAVWKKLIGKMALLLKYFL